MEAAEDDCTFGLDEVKHAVRKSPHERATDPSMRFGVGFRMISNDFENGLEGLEEVVAQAGGPSSVPAVGLRKVCLRLRCEADDHSPLVRRDRMTDQG